MSLPKLFAFAGVMTLKQQRSLRKHLLSRFGPESDPFAIFEYMCTQYDWTQDYPGNEAMTAAILPNTSMKVYLNYLSQLYDHAQEWMAMEQLRSQEYDQDLLVQRWLNRHGLYHLADQMKEKIIKSIKAEDGLDYNHARVLSEVHFEHAFSNNPYKYEFREEDYVAMVETFDEFASSHLIVMLNEMKNIAFFTKNEHEELHTFITNKLDMSRDTELIRILKATHRMINEDDCEALMDVRDALLGNKLKVGSKIQKLLTLYAVRRSTRFWTMGLHKDTKLIYDLTLYGLNSGVYYNEGKIATSIFHNLIVNLSIYMAYDDMNDFIDTWIGHVNTQDHKATRNLARAQNCFYKHRYHEIYQGVLTGELDFNQKNIAQGLHLISTFMNRSVAETEYHRALAISKHFIRRNKARLTTHLYNSYINLFRFMKDYDYNNGKDINLDEYLPLLYLSWCQYLLKNY